MSYTTIAQCANDEAFAPRLKACLAQEGSPNPDADYSLVRWAIAADPSIEPPYEYAVNADNPNPGGDETVITDPMILSAVQAHGLPERAT